MSEIFQVGLTRDFLGADGKTPIFDPRAFEVLRGAEGAALQYMHERRPTR